MKASQGLLKKLTISLAALAFVLLVAAPASAAVLQIQFSGLNLVYSDPGGDGGGSLCDTNSACLGGGGAPGTADPLFTMNFIVDGMLVGTLNSNIWADINVGVVGAVPAGGGTVNTAGGIFDILTVNATPGWGLALNLGAGTLTFADEAMSFVGAATVASFFGENLPFGLDIAMPIQVSYSTNVISGFTTAGGFITGANLAGTGEIIGQVPVPEPASILLLGSGLAFAARQVRRRRTAR